MTTRLAMAVVLLLMLMAQAWGLVSVLRQDPLRNLAVMEKKKAKAQVVMPREILSLQPVPPTVLPDLNQGYIFNAERNLADGEGRDGQAQSAGNVGMDKVRYNGSIISEENIRALLSYPLVAPGIQQKQGFLRVVVGDTVDGYKVTDILPEKIVFSRGGQKITKWLYDRTKERVQGQPSAAAGGETRAPLSPATSARTIRNIPKQNSAPRILPPPKRPFPPQNRGQSQGNTPGRAPEPPMSTPAPEAPVLVPDDIQGTPAPPGSEMVPDDFQGPPPVKSAPAH